MSEEERWLDGLKTDFLPQTITAEEMSFIDENSAALGIPRLLLMENAGAASADLIDREYAAEGKKAVVVSGLGNNGGDGFVVCRHLLNRGAKVGLVLLGRSEEIKTDEAKLNWNVLEKMDLNLTRTSILDSAELDKLRKALENADIVVDAILGTGVRGKLREPISSSVKAIDDSGKIIVAIDTPTGLNPSTGEIHGVAIKATMTLTFHKMKRGFEGHSDLTGKVRVVDIGIPVEAELFCGPGDVRRVTIPRTPFSSKRNYGAVLVIGGSDLYSGAPGLVALSALRTGAGLCLIAAPEEVSSAIRSFSPNLIVHPLPGRVVSPADVGIISNLLGRVTSVAMGPGLGRQPETREAVVSLVKIVSKAGLPMLIDAEAIIALKDNLDILRNTKTVLTPHAGEFKAVTGLDVSEDWKQKAKPAMDFARRAGCTLLLKGHHTVITDGTVLRVNRTGNPILATAGSGDVLSGIISAYLAHGQEPLAAAAAGAFIHGCAGDLTFQEKGFHATALDFIEKLPAVIKPFDRVG
jgi:ADP-dependent NAD(P)H-hydrate dehydratase / NAD(P)H-hydrate epimerase